MIYYKISKQWTFAAFDVLFNRLLFPVDVERTIAMHEVAEVERGQSEGARRELSLPADKDDVVIIYNRVPKTASTSFTNIAYDLCGKNHFHVLHINTTKNNPVLSLQDQVRHTTAIGRHSDAFEFMLESVGFKYDVCVSSADDVWYTDYSQ